MAEKKNPKEVTLEERIAALEALMETMEEGEPSIEEAFSSYQKGVALLKECNDSLDLMEKKLIILEEESTGKTQGE